MRCPTCAEDNLPGEDLCRNCGMDLAGLDVAAWGLDPADPLLVKPLAELSLKQAPVLSPASTVGQAIELMKQSAAGCVMVEDAGTLVGVFTEHDVAARVAARGRDPAKTKLADVLTPNPVTLNRNDPLSWALHRMGVDGYRHLPVLDRGKLCGYLSVRAVLRAFHEA